MAAKEFHFTNKRDKRLQAFAYVPNEDKEIRACLVFHHGYAEHSGRKAPSKRTVPEHGKE
jgi:cephalosporin-C deacetylase-like acetyl esterase